MFLKFLLDSQETKTFVLQSLSNKVIGQGPAILLKRDFSTGVYLKICESFENTFSIMESGGCF